MGSQLLKLSVFSSGSSGFNNHLDKVNPVFSVNYLLSAFNHTTTVAVWITPSIMFTSPVITTSGSNGASEQKLKRSILILKPLLSHYRRYWSAALRRSWAILKSTSTDPFSKVAIMVSGCWILLITPFGPARALLADLAVLDLDEAISPKCGLLFPCWTVIVQGGYKVLSWCCNCMDADGCIDLGGLLRVTTGYGIKVLLSVGSDGQPDIIKEWQIEERQLRFASMVYLGEEYVNNPTLSDVSKRFYAHRICLLASSDAFRAMFDGGYRVIDFQDVSLQPLSTNKIPCDGAKPGAISAPDNLLALASKVRSWMEKVHPGGGGIRQGTQERDHSSERIGMFTRKVWNCRRVNLRVHSVVKKAHLGLVTALAFSQDSRDLVFASLDSSARVTQIKETKNNACFKCYRRENKQ
ncbi:hypothetical protein Lser_V15G27758 [Lactuca serriola]